MGCRGCWPLGGVFDQWVPEGLNGAPSPVHIERVPDRQYPSQSHHAREPVRSEIVVTLPRAIGTARGSASAIGSCEDWPAQPGVARWLQLVSDLLVSCGRAARCPC